VLASLVSLAGCGGNVVVDRNTGGSGGAATVSASSSSSVSSSSSASSSSTASSSRASSSHGSSSSNASSSSSSSSCVVEVAATFSETCARKRDDTLWCWGSDLFGAFGNGAGMTQHLPVQVTSLKANVAEVALGEQHTCARTIDGALWCWG